VSRRILPCNLHPSRLDIDLTQKGDIKVKSENREFREVIPSTGIAYLTVWPGSSEHESGSIESEVI